MTTKLFNQLKWHTFKQHQKETLKPVGPSVTPDPVESVKEAQAPEEKSECVHCYASCDHEKEFDFHTKTNHDASNGQECQNCKTKDTIISDQGNKIERLELKVSSIEMDLKQFTLDNRKITEEKVTLLSDYNEAARSIAE